MSPKKTMDDSEGHNEPEDAKTEGQPQGEEHPTKAQEHPAQAEAHPRPEPGVKAEPKVPVRTKAKSEAEPKPAAKPAATTSIAEVMKFHIRIGNRPRR